MSFCDYRTMEQAQSDGPGELYVGAAQPGAELYQGLLQDVRMYARKLQERYANHLWRIKHEGWIKWIDVTKRFGYWFVLTLLCTDQSLVHSQPSYCLDIQHHPLWFWNDMLCQPANMIPFSKYIYTVTQSTLLLSDPSKTSTVIWNDRLTVIWSHAIAASTQYAQAVE